MAISTVTQISAPVNFIHQEKFLRRAKPLLTYFIGSVPGNIKHHEGSFSIQWRRFTDLTPTTTPLTALSGSISLPTRTSTTLAKTDVTATLAKYGAYIALNEEVDLVNPNTQAAELMNVVGQQAGRSANFLQRNELEDNAALTYASGGSADGDVAAPISVGLIEKAINDLDRQNALKFESQSDGSTKIGSSPLEAAYWGLCHSDVKADIRKLANYQSVIEYSSHTATRKGEFGATGDIRWLSSSDGSVDADLGAAPGGSLRSTSGIKADLYTTIVLGQDYHGAVGFDAPLPQEVLTAGDDMAAFEIIAHGRGTSGAADPLNELSTLGWKLWHAATILNANFGLGLRVASNKLA